jgi:Glycosyltransferases involved in cell wall biogenesis
MITLWLVIPCYDEENVLRDSADYLIKLIEDLIRRERISNKSKIAFVNDGSKDKTWQIIKELHQNDSIFVGINLSKHRGQQNALMAGLMMAKKYADVAITLDADLQDDIQVVEKFLDEYHHGHDIVYGVRYDRKTDFIGKKLSAEGFYKLLKHLNPDIIYNHGDFRLMSRRTLEALSEYEEVNLFLRGIIPQLGYPSINVPYSRKKRMKGKSKYSIFKMISFALEGITSVSIKPIRIAFLLSVIALTICVAMIIYCLIRHFQGFTVSGWTSLSISIWGIGGLQLFMIGIIGEYIGKIYLETKHRPRYRIESFLYEESTKK